MLIESNILGWVLFFFFGGIGVFGSLAGLVLASYTVKEMIVKRKG